MKNKLFALIPEWLRHKFLKIKLCGDGNKVVDEDGRPVLCSGLKIKVRGNNNKIVIAKSIKIRNFLKIGIRGDNCSVIINQGIELNCLEILFDTNLRNATVEIGRNTTIGQMKIVQVEDNSVVRIGEDCQISFDVLIYNSDTHPIFDLATGERINQVTELSIGDHCWLGMKSTILKNVHISNNCIVGSNANVVGKFLKENCVIAGNPAKICKTGIFWKRHFN